MRYAMRRVLGFTLAVCGCASAQDALKLRDALEWTIAQRGRMAQMASPVVRVYGMASLAALVCAENPLEGSGLYRDAIGSLHNVPTGAFDEKGTTVLPAASFTGLWKYVVPAALKCDPLLADVTANERSKERIESEHAAANATLKRAWDLVDPNAPLDKQDNQDRAAQVANAALDAGDPETLDIELLAEVISRVRERVPELAEDLFDRAVDFVMSAEIPDPGKLLELSKGSPADADPDELDELTDAATRLLARPESVNRNPEAARELSAQAQLRFREAEGEEPPPGPRRDDWLVSRIQNALSAGRAAAAREMLPRLNDSNIRAQLVQLVNFHETARAIQTRAEEAMPMANMLRGGIKRSLLYIGVIAGAKKLDQALQVLPLAQKDIAQLPAEQRVRLCAALATALVHVDVQSATPVADLMVKAYNDVYVNPRRGRFEPRLGGRASSDSSLILTGKRGFHEAVQTQIHRHTFTLKLAGAEALNVGDFLMAAGSIDPGMLEALILGLKDENTRAGALVRLGRSRIHAAGTAPAPR
jgi:hypothetical protein